MRQPTIHQMREKKNHRGKVKEVERLQYRAGPKGELLFRSSNRKEWSK
jgi:hypothetical protein